MNENVAGKGFHDEDEFRGPSRAEEIMEIILRDYRERFSDSTVTTIRQAVENHIAEIAREMAQPHHYRSAETGTGAIYQRKAEKGVSSHVDKREDLGAGGA